MKRRAHGAVVLATSLFVAGGVLAAPPAPAAPTKGAKDAPGTLVAPVASASIDAAGSLAGPSVSRAASSPTARPLLLPDVLASVAQSYAPLGQAQMDIREAEGAALAARGAFDPLWRTRAAVAPLGTYDTYQFDTFLQQPTSLWGSSVFAGYRWGRGNFASYDGKLATLDAGEVRAGILVPLLRDGPIDARRAALQTTQLATEASRAAAEIARLDALRLASVRYWTWVEAGLVLQVAQRLVVLAEHRDEVLALRVAHGDISEVERIDNARTVLARKSAVLSAERAFTTASLELSLFLHDADRRPIVPLSMQLPEAFPDVATPPKSEDEERLRLALQRRPEFAQLAAQRRQIAVDFELARNSSRPAIDLAASVSQDIGQGSSSLRPTVFEMSLSFDVPVVGRTPQGRIDAASARMEKLALRERFLRERITADVRDALAGERLAFQQLELARAELKLAERVAEAERDALDAGQSTIMLVNLREQAVADASTRLFRALGDFHRSAAALRAACAEP